MFCISDKEIEFILKDYHIIAGIIGVTELERYNFEEYGPDTKYVRLITKVDFDGVPSVVVRLKNEDDVTIEIIESQSQFADELKKHGIITPLQYKANGRFANEYSIGGYSVIVTVEQFEENEIKTVGTTAAKKTGELMAKTHNIAERNDLHVKNRVLFNPFEKNDLFAFDDFMSMENALHGEDKALFDRITDKYNLYMEILAPLREYPKYAVQGDMSCCNLFFTAEGELGVFDFNRCGDNILFCDAVMQALFVARLMDYPDNKESDFENKVLTAFWEGYCSVRDFSNEERRWYPYLYAIIDAFWSFDISYNDDSLLEAHKAGDLTSVRRWLETIWKRLSVLSR